MREAHQFKIQHSKFLNQNSASIPGTIVLSPFITCSCVTPSLITLPHSSASSLPCISSLWNNKAFETSNKSKGDIKQIYKQFFANARNYLKGDGRIIMYTHNREFVKEFANVSGFYVLEHKIILEKAGTDLFILQVR